MWNDFTLCDAAAAAAMQCHAMALWICLLLQPNTLFLDAFKAINNDSKPEPKININNNSG